MYAAGKPSPQKEACCNLLEKLRDAEIDAASSAEVLQEILHRYRAIGRFKEGCETYDAFRSLPIRWLEILPEDADQAREILGAYPHVSSRDALHLGVMQRNGIKKIATYDKGFLGLPTITVFLPEQL